MASLHHHAQTNSNPGVECVSTEALFNYGQREPLTIKRAINRQRRKSIPPYIANAGFVISNQNHCRWFIYNITLTITNPYSSDTVLWIGSPWIQIISTYDNHIDVANYLKCWQLRMIRKTNAFLCHVSKTASFRFKFHGAFTWYMAHLSWAIKRYHLCQPSCVTWLIMAEMTVPWLARCSSSGVAKILSAH